MKTPDGKAVNGFHMKHPNEMWDSVIGQYVQYCPTDAAKAFQCGIGDDINIEGYNENDHIARVTFTRPDGYQVAIIKFLMEGNK